MISRYHPPRQPRYPQPLSWEAVTAVYADCADFGRRKLCPAGEGERAIRVCWLDGRVKAERLNDYIFHPILTAHFDPEGNWQRQLEEEILWNQNPRPCGSTDQAVYGLIEGACLIFTREGVLECMVPTEDRRGVEKPENESGIKGAKDSFTETVRVNTSLIRSRLRTPELIIRRHLVGRQTRTPVEMLWIRGLCDPAWPARIAGRLEEIQEDALLTTAELEDYLIPTRSSPFPRLFFTQRPDRVCQGLLEGRVALLIDGVPQGCILPGELSQFLQAPQDRSDHWLAASSLTCLRYLCMVLTLLLPGLYVAMAQFHFELIPTKLALSIIASKQDVPFPTALEVLGLLLAFEVLQEAGLRLPNTIGQTVSIIGGLVVGQAAVEAKIVSPVVVIVVAAAGVSGFTMPNQDLSNALRIWRFLLTLLSAGLGIYGLALGSAGLIVHLAGLEDYGLAYLASFTGPGPTPEENHPVIRRPVPRVKYRPAFLNTANRRKRR